MSQVAIILQKCNFHNVADHNYENS
jgi:hypothetical protein